MPLPRQRNGITSPRRLYLSLDGEIVEAKDPRRHTLLAAAGVLIPQADVDRYGVIAYLEKDGPEAVAAITGPPETSTTGVGVTVGGPTVAPPPQPNLQPPAPPESDKLSDDTKALEKLTVDKLKALAADNGVTLVGDEKKADLVTALASRGVKAPE